MRKFNGNANKIDKKFIRSIILGTVLSCVIIALLLIISAMVLVQLEKYPGDIINYMGLVFIAVGVLMGSYVAGRLNKSSGLLCGMATGLAVFIILITAGLNNVCSISLMILFKLGVNVICGCIGGILGVNKKEKLHIK